MKETYINYILFEMPYRHFYLILEYAISKVQETNLGLDKNDINQVLAYADDSNLIGHDIIKI